MCRYCENLKRIKDLREKELLQCIERWRLRDLEARNIISLLCEFADMVGDDTSYICLSEFDRCQSVLSRARSFLETEWIGG